MRLVVGAEADCPSSGPAVSSGSRVPQMARGAPRANCARLRSVQQAFAMPPLRGRHRVRQVQIKLESLVEGRLPRPSLESLPRRKL